MISDDKVIIGILVGILFLIFYVEKLPNRYSKLFFSIFPPVLLCYFIPGVLSSLHVIDAKFSDLYKMASNYLLPICLIFFTLSLDFSLIKLLGKKAIIIFLSGTFGIIIGGPIALYFLKLIDPSLFIEHPDIWRGTATIAGSWIGGGANQTALKEIFKPSDYIFSQTVAVDIIIAEAWLAVLLIGVNKNKQINRWIGVEKDSLDDLLVKVNQNEKPKLAPTFYDLLQIMAVGIVSTSLAHLIAQWIAPYLKTNYPQLESYSVTSPFFWVVFIVTILGLIYSQTELRNLESKGTTTIGSLFLYFLIATIGMQMDITAIVDNPFLFLFGVCWMLIHLIVLFLTAKLIKAPYFYIAVGSQANVGGAASAPIVAAAFHPSLASVGVILAILGYLVGTYGGYISAILMKWVAEL